MLGGANLTTQRRRHARQLDPGRVPQASVERAAVRNAATPGATPTSSSDTASISRSRRSLRPARSATFSTRSRPTGSTSCRSARTRSGASNVGGFVDALIGGWIVRRRRAHSDRRAAGLRQRPPGRHVDRRVPRRRSKLRVGAERPDLHPAGRHHREHREGVRVSATSANGYGALGAPTGRYLAPANGPDCIEDVARLRRLRHAQPHRQRARAWCAST